MQNSIIRKVTLKEPISDKEILRVINKHLLSRGKSNCILDVEIVGKRKMRSLNKKFMDHDYATDVLSFPVAAFPKPTDYDFIGTVVLCNDIIDSQAKRLGRTFSQEFCFYLCHGIDHLVGIHHK
jgi:probable rRNA maturation factor